MCVANYPVLHMTKCRYTCGCNTASRFLDAVHTKLSAVPRLVHSNRKLRFTRFDPGLSVMSSMSRIVRAVSRVFPAAGGRLVRITAGELAIYGLINIALWSNEVLKTN